MNNFQRFEGEILRSRITALDMASRFIRPGFIGIAAWDVLVLHRFVKYDDGVFWAVAWLAIAAFVISGLLYWLWRVRTKQELELGYTTGLKEPAGVLIEYDTRLIIRQIGEPDPSNQEFQAIRRELRELQKSRQPK
ncbi:MAG TPA: hypothetical protein VK139_03820 [Microbacteriaceae bacterium]|nr:hypothetical protein [Microbacteriaceae bacterium]